MSRTPIGYDRAARTDAALKAIAKQLGAPRYKHINTGNDIVFLVHRQNPIWQNPPYGVRIKVIN